MGKEKEESRGRGGRVAKRKRHWSADSRKIWKNAKSKVEQMVQGNENSGFAKLKEKRKEKKDGKDSKV